MNIDQSFEFSNTNKRYHTLDYYFKEKFGFKVARVPINAGFTCPNINGEKGFGGCTFCNIKGSGDFAGARTDDLELQWENGKKMMQKKWPNAQFLAYFQSFSNTFSTVEVLRAKFDYFADKKECIGISIATRPDCLEEDIVEYLAELNQKTMLIVELGLQTSNDKTGDLINRGHDYECYVEGVNKLRAVGIDVVAHIINGLPRETKEDMIQTAKDVSKLDIQGLKIHLLHVMEGTKLVNQLNNGFLKLLSMEDYIDITVEQLELINPKVVIHRLTGDAPSDIFVGPIWSKKKVIVLNNIDKELKKRDTYQGRKYKEE